MNKLLIDFPDYLPTYYHAAALDIQLNQGSQAESILQKGIALAKIQGDNLALRELQNAANELLFDDWFEHRKFI